MANIFSISLGCPKNRVDTERLLATVPGMRAVASVAEASCVLVNTCGFIEPAVTESVAVIAEIIHDIADLPGAQKPLLVVSGCLVGRYGENVLAPELPEVTLWLDNRDLDSWPGKLLAALREAGHILPVPSPGGCGLPHPVRYLSTPPSYAWLKISDGCDHTCSFCTIPSIRGAFYSTPADFLIAEARELLGKGVRELILVAQDSTAWGKDLAGEKGLVSLLEKLLPLNGLDWLRIMYLYPAGLSRELLSFLKSAGRPFLPYFDIPVQHAHNAVLSKMGRPFAKDPSISLDRVREFFPDAAFRTSIIVGFPGETDDHFKTVYDFVEKTRFHNLGVFTYQAEEGTKAAAMPGQIPEHVKEERRDALMALQADISEEILDEYVGEYLEVLVDKPNEEWPGLYEGRAWFQAPDIDGLTYVSGPGVAEGVMVRAEVTEARTYDLVALTDPE
ncbi:MAG: Ribosomal protein S12 methylthiotransferase RimO [Desulfovibrio sp.]